MEVDPDAAHEVEHGEIISGDLDRCQAGVLRLGWIVGPPIRCLRWKAPHGLVTMGIPSDGQIDAWRWPVQSRAVTSLSTSWVPPGALDRSNGGVAVPNV